MSLVLVKVSPCQKGDFLATFANLRDSFNCKRLYKTKVELSYAFSSLLFFATCNFKQHTHTHARAAFC